MELDGLVQRIEEWQREYGSNKPLADEEPRRLKKSSSTESMRPVEETMRSMSRKRRFGSSLRGKTPSSSSRFTKNLGAGYYSTQIQRQMESLVKKITLGRGYVRKGKITARINAITRRPIATRTQVLDETTSFGVPSLPHSTAAQSDVQTDTSSEEALEEVDSALVESQTLCENAAHFLLRDGDCDGELEEVRRHFADIVRVCESEQSKLAAKLAEEESTPEHESDTEPFALSSHDFQAPVMSLNPLEVDDDDEDYQKETEDFFFMKVPNFRATRMTTAH